MLGIYHDKLAEELNVCPIRSNVLTMPTADQNDRPEQPVFHVGDRIPESGIYRVHHSEHRPSHEVTLLRNEIFPQCAKCGGSVRFELLRSAPGLEQKNFCVRLYNIPHEEPEAA